MKTTPQSSRPLRSGFTLLEIAVSLAVIGFAIVAVLGVLPTGLNIQRDTRERTIVLQDASYFVEAIRHGASDVTEAYPSTQLANSVQRMWRVFEDQNSVRTTELADRTRDFPTDGDVIRLLSEPSHDLPGGVRYLYSVALLRSLSGSASEKGGRAPDNRISFSYLLKSQILPIDTTIPFETLTRAVTNQVNLDVANTLETVTLGELRQREKGWLRLGTNLSEMRFTIYWPPIPEDYSPDARYKNKIALRTFTSGAVGTNSLSVYSIQPRRFL
ncbi:MAG: type II secretion system protein [Verrucomicrobia bacterium]|nr:type II secretion system protein [Verrucomicrobiota bacterium]MBI3869956.1 type II secretion system protein [Verrucomicrobiota bacterium]